MKESEEQMGVRKWRLLFKEFGIKEERERR